MTDAKRCPGCGHPNSCPQAGQIQPVQDCWCFHIAVDPAMLDSPAAQRDQACLCPRCAQSLPSEPEQPD